MGQATSGQRGQCGHVTWAPGKFKATSLPCESFQSIPCPPQLRQPRLSSRYPSLPSAVALPSSLRARTHCDR